MFDMMEGAPDKSTMMEIYFDWRSWLEQGIPDEVTLKNFHSNPHKIHFGRELIARCNAKNIPVYNGPRDSGANGRIIYEHAFAFAAQLDGTIKEIKPGWTENIRKKIKAEQAVNTN